MIAIGNGEKCLYCDKIMENNRIDNKPMIDHLFEKHGDETLSQLFKNVRERERNETDKIA